jgi:hypothetical protein
LAARGETTQDLLANVFKGYQAASDNTFVSCISRKLKKYEEGENIMSVELMRLGDNKFSSLREGGLWNAPLEEEENILALQAEIKKLKKSKKDPNKPNKERDDKQKSIKETYLKSHHASSKNQKKMSFANQRFGMTSRGITVLRRQAESVPDNTADTSPQTAMLNILVDGSGALVWPAADLMALKALVIMVDMSVFVDPAGVPDGDLLKAILVALLRLM